MASLNRPKNTAEQPPRYGMGQEVRRFHFHRRHLNKILQETHKALKDVQHLQLFPLESEISDTVRSSHDKLLRPPALVAMGPARARLVNFLLGETLLPPQESTLTNINGGTFSSNAGIGQQQTKKTLSSSQGWRWLRLQHGSKKQIRLSFGSDIEIVDPSLSMETGWDQIPHQYLQRNSALDISTVVDIDINHPILEQGLQILVPPESSDISMTSNPSSGSLSQSSTHQDLFTKRGPLLENVVPVIIYALDQLDDTIRGIDLNKIKTKMKQMTIKREDDHGEPENVDEEMRKSNNLMSRFKDFSFLRNLKVDERFGHVNKGGETKSDAKFYLNLDINKSKTNECSKKVNKTNELSSKDAKNSPCDNGNLKESCDKTKTESDECYAGLSDENLLDLRQIYDLHPNAQVLFVLFSNNLVEPLKNDITQSTSSSVPSKMNSNDHLNSASFCLNHSFNDSPSSLTYMTASECSSITSHLSEYVKNFIPLECERLHVNTMGNNGKENASALLSPNCLENQEMNDSKKKEVGIQNLSQDCRWESCDGTTESMMFAMDEDKDKILDKQMAYLATLVQQLGLMTHPLSKTQFTGHWLIVDDSKINHQQVKSTQTLANHEQVRKQLMKDALNKGVSGSGAAMQRDDFMYSLVTFTKGCLQNYILEDCNNLNEIHNALLQQFILSSFDMAREMQIVPRRIHYVAEMEQHLYDKLLEKFSGWDKREELLGIVEKVLRDMTDIINSMDWAGPNCRGSHECLNVTNSVFYSRDGNEMTSPIQNIVKTTPTTQFTEYNSTADIFENITNGILEEYHMIDSIPRETNLDVVVEEANEIINPIDQSAGIKGCKNVVNFEYGMNSSLHNSYKNSNTNLERSNCNTSTNRTNSKLTNGTDLKMEGGAVVAGNSLLENNLKLTSQLESALNSISTKERNLKMERGLKKECSDSNQTDSRIGDGALNLNVEVLKGVDSIDSGNYTNDSSSNTNSHCSKVTFKQASLDVQKIVLAKLSRNISVQLVKYVDCLRDSYFGTLQRCLEALEEGQGMRSASEAVRRILLVTRSVDLQHCASFSFLSVLVDQLRRFFQRVSAGRGGSVGGLVSTTGSCCVDSPRWRREVAHNTLQSLNAAKLCKIISTQLKERVRSSHEQFQSALHTLSEHHSVRLQQTEELKINVRKRHAPRFAGLCLESSSLADLIKYGLPHMGKEIGRGHYGVVYAVKGSWADCTPLAVKSVVPPDERNFNELAMEFFHTRNIPPHDRIVRLVGSVIDYSYGGGGGLPAVLLVSERLKWDLQCALAQCSMTFVQRMQVAVDIVEGIRYLHSQGLVHRDIKLKNVLLREDNRAKLTDLGFCIPEAMISGSVVGTPVHMAPELFNGIYDYSVDVYAFGILFWYLCAGHVTLPLAFDFLNKEQLWCSVRRGLRPERLPIFSDVCWDLMRSCWSGDPNLRPLLGDVQPVLEKVRDHPQEHVRGYEMDTM